MLEERLLLVEVVDHKLVGTDAVVVEERMQHIAAVDLGSVEEVRYIGIVAEQAVIDYLDLQLNADLPSIRRRCMVLEHLQVNHRMSKEVLGGLHRCFGGGDPFVVALLGTDWLGGCYWCGGVWVEHLGGCEGWDLVGDNLAVDFGVVEDDLVGGLVVAALYLAQDRMVLVHYEVGNLPVSREFEDMVAVAVVDLESVRKAFCSKTTNCLTLRSWRVESCRILLWWTMLRRVAPTSTIPRLHSIWSTILIRLLTLRHGRFE